MSETIVERNTQLMINAGYEVSGEQVRPWVRYLARIVDILILGFILGIFIGILISMFSIDVSFIEGIPEIAINTLFMGIYVFFEPLVFYIFNTTPGKAILKIRLRKSNGERLSYMDSLQRTLLLWLKGLALSIPLISFVTLAISYGKLVDEGETSWDRDGDLVVSHQEIGIVRVTLAILLALASIYVVVAIQTI